MQQPSVVPAPHPSNKFVEVTIVRARGLLARDAHHAVAPITSEGLDVFVAASSTYRVTADDLAQDPRVMEPLQERVQLHRTTAVAANPVNPDWPSDPAGVERCRFQCPVAAMPLELDVFGSTLSKDLFLGRATLRKEHLSPTTATTTSGNGGGRAPEIRLELLPREKETDRVVLSAADTFATGLGLLVVTARVIECPPPPPPPEPPARLIDIKVPYINVLASPDGKRQRANASGMSMCLIPDVAQPQRPGLVDVTVEMQEDALELEARDPATPLHVAQMVEISLHSCAQVVHTWLAELRAAHQLWNPGRPPPPPPQKFEVLLDVFGTTFSSGLLSTNLEEVTQNCGSAWSSSSSNNGDDAGGAVDEYAGSGAPGRRGVGSALPLFSVYGSVCAAPGSPLPLRLRFVDGTGAGGGGNKAEDPTASGNNSGATSAAMTRSNSQESSRGGTPSEQHSALLFPPGSYNLMGGSERFDGREVFAETVLNCSVPVPDPEQFGGGRDAVHPYGKRSSDGGASGSSHGLVGNRALLPVSFHTKDSAGHGPINIGRCAAELSVRSVSCVPAKSVSESNLHSGKGLLKIEVREVRDLLTPQMIAAAAAAAAQPKLGVLRSTGIGLHHSPSRKSSASHKSSAAAAPLTGAASATFTTSSTRGMNHAVNNNNRSPSPAGSEKESDSHPQQQQQQQDDKGTDEGRATVVGEEDLVSERSGATTVRSRPNKYQHSAASGKKKPGDDPASSAAAAAPEPLYCEVAIKDRADDREYKLLGKSACVFPDSDSFFGFTTTVEMDNIRCLPEVIIVGIYQGGGNCIAKSIVHVLERRAIDGTWVTLKPPVASSAATRRALNASNAAAAAAAASAAGDDLRGMVWVRWVATPTGPTPTELLQRQQRQQQGQLLSAQEQRERDSAMAVGGSRHVAPVQWIQQEALVPDLVRSPAAPNGVCEMVLRDVPLSYREGKPQPQQQDSVAASFPQSNAATIPAHEVGYREGGALCIDWNAMPVGYCLRLKQGDRVLFGPALRAQGVHAALKAPPVVVYLEGTVNGAPPLVFETFRSPEEGAPLVVRASDRVYERKCWLPVDVNLLQQHPPVASQQQQRENSAFAKSIFNVHGGDVSSSWLEAQNAASAAGVTLRHHLSHVQQAMQGGGGHGAASASSSRGSGGGGIEHTTHNTMLVSMLRGGGGGGGHDGKRAAFPQHPPCFTVALDEIAAIQIPCRWVPLVKKIPPPPPASRARTPPMSVDELERRAREQARCNKRRQPPLHLRIVGPAFPAVPIVLEEEETLAKIMPILERHFGIPPRDQLFHQGKLKLLPNGRPQVAGTASKEQAKVYTQPAVVTRLAGEGPEEHKIRVIDVILSSKDPRALYVSVRLPSVAAALGTAENAADNSAGVVVPMSVPYPTTVGGLRAMLREAVVERKLIDPATGTTLADTVAPRIGRLCHFTRILPDDTALRSLGLRADVPLIAMLGGEQPQQQQPRQQASNADGAPPVDLGGTARAESVGAASSSAASHMDIVHSNDGARSNHTGSGSSAVAPGGAMRGRSPPPVPPLQLGIKGKEAARNNAPAAATHDPQRKQQLPAVAAPKQHQQHKPAVAAPAAPSAGTSRPQQRAAATAQQVAAATNYEHGETSARAMLEVRELKEQLQSAYARIAQLEKTVETQRVLLKRVADSMGPYH